MTKIFSSILIFIFCAIFVNAQEVNEKNKFTVLGSVELQEIADEASFSFTVKGIGENLRKAVEDAEVKTKRIIDKLVVLGLKNQNIATSDFTSGENYGDKAFLSASRDFRAKIITAIKTDDLKLLQPLIFTVSESEVESMSRIIFSHKNELQLRRQVRIEAAKKAREKAEDIAESLNIKIGKVLEIEELPPIKLRNNFNTLTQNYPNPFNPSANSIKQMSIDETKGSGFFAQTVSFTSQIKVTFQIE